MGHNTTKLVPDFSLENKYKNNKIKYIIGLDEAGRGPWAGPIYSSAVIIQTNNDIENINDSKQLSEKKRLNIFKKITNNNKILFTYTKITSTEIDQRGLGESSKKIFQKSIDNIIKKYKIDPKECLAIIDGNIVKKLSIPFENIIKGDQKSITIAAASIIAKVKRDEYMKQISKKFSNFFFEKNKGYGTKEHSLAIEKYGICSEHRVSFKPIKKFLSLSKFEMTNNNFKEKL